METGQGIDFLGRFSNFHDAAFWIGLLSQRKYARRIGCSSGWNIDGCGAFL
jgi:hypothetical protein